MTALIDLISKSFPSVLNLFEVLLVVTALLATTSETVGQAITYYRWQSGLLTVVATATAIARAPAQPAQSAINVDILIMLIALLPALLAIAIRPLLQRATVGGHSRSAMDDIKMLLAAILRIDMPPGYRQRVAAQERDAEAEWRRRQTMKRELGSLLLFPLSLLVAFLIPFAIATNDFDSSERIGLSVSLALHLIGLYSMVIRRDIISQVIGLLIMDHGLYLAVVKIVEIPVPAGFFVWSLYFYTLITIFILVILLPRVRSEFESIELDRISEKSDLRSGAGS